MDGDSQKAPSAVFEARASIRAAPVFGSFARGNGRVDSDLAVAVRPGRPLSAGEKMDLVESLALRFGRPVDIVDLSVHHGPIAYDALARGELVYRPDRSAYAERLRRTLYDQEDCVPTLRKTDQMAIEKWLKTSYAPKSAP